MALISKDVSLDLTELKKQYENKKSFEEYIKTKEIDMEKQKIADLKHNAKVKIMKYNDFKEDVKFEVLHKALTRLCENSLRNPTDEQINACSNLIESYIKDNGMYNVLRRMSNSRNLLLRELAEDIKNTSEELIDSAQEDEEGYTINKDTIDDFIKEIDNNDDINDVTNIIRLRVSNAEEDFVNKNEQDNENIKTILKDTAERVKNAKDDNDNDYAEEIEESEMRIASKEIYKIQHENRNSVFDRIVKTIAKNSLLTSNEAVTDGNKINVEAVVDIAKSVYTVLEMFSATLLEKVDDEYINDTINSL
nr:MAG TPA: hypothetical protein [Caudoviricetes sp.]